MFKYLAIFGIDFLTKMIPEENYSTILQLKAMACKFCSTARSTSPPSARADFSRFGTAHLERERERERMRVCAETDIFVPPFAPTKKK